MSFAGGNNSGQGGDLNSEINVTPFVDVMLVLLIIFMVAAPMMTVGVPVDLPKAALAEPPQESKPVDIFVRKDGAIYFGEQHVADADLAASLAALPPETREQRVRLRADREVPYDRVISLIEALTASGFTRVGLVAAPKAEPLPP